MCAKAVRLSCALLGRTRPPTGALLATLNHLPEVGGVNRWEDVARAAQGTGIPASRKVDFVSAAIGTFHLGYALAFKGGDYLNASGHDGYLACNGCIGRIVWPDMTQPALHIEAPGRRPIREKTFRLRTSSSYSGASGERFVSRFMAARRGRAELPATLADAEQTARVIEAAYLSARTRRAVPLRVSRT